MTASASDYAWIDSWRNGLLASEYCMTLARLPPGEVLDRLGATERTRSTLDGVLERIWAAPGGMLVAVAPVGQWSVMYELNGFVGVTRRLMLPVSTSTTVVSHYVNVNVLNQFVWLEDGQVLLDFEPLGPSWREGSRALDVAAELAGAGFDLREDSDRSIDGWRPATFAFAERLTSVRVTPELLDSASFECGAVTLW